MDETNRIVLMTTDIIHKSKIGLEFLVPIVLVLGTVTTIMIINVIWIGLVVCGLIILLMVNIYTGTNYTITCDNRLLIKCGVLESFDISVNDIEWVRKSDNIMGPSVISAPALSIDRLEIGHKGGTVLVSPKDKKRFVGDLRKLNAKIWWTN